MFVFVAIHVRFSLVHAAISFEQPTLDHEDTMEARVYSPQPVSRCNYFSRSYAFIEEGGSNFKLSSPSSVPSP